MGVKFFSSIFSSILITFIYILLNLMPFPLFYCFRDFSEASIYSWSPSLLFLMIYHLLIWLQAETCEESLY